MELIPQVAGIGAMVMSGALVAVTAYLDRKSPMGMRPWWLFSGMGLAVMGMAVVMGYGFWLSKA